MTKEHRLYTLEELDLYEALIGKDRSLKGQLIQAAFESLKSLSPHRATVLEKYLIENMDLHQIATVLSHSPSRAGQLKDQAITFLKLVTSESLESVGGQALRMFQLWGLEQAHTRSGIHTLNDLLNVDGRNALSAYYSPGTVVHLKRSINRIRMAVNAAA